MKLLRKKDQKLIALRIYELQLLINKYSDSVNDFIKSSELLSDIGANCGMETLQEVLRLMNEPAKDIEKGNEENDRRKEA